MCSTKWGSIYLTKGLIKKYGPKHKMDGQDGCISLPLINYAYSELFGDQNESLKDPIDPNHQARCDLHRSIVQNIWATVHWVRPN